MSNNANRFSQSFSSVLNLQGLTLEAAIAEAEDCFCSGCGGREGQFVPDGPNGGNYVCEGIAPFRDSLYCEVCAGLFVAGLLCQCGDWRCGDLRVYDPICERCHPGFFCECGIPTRTPDLCWECQTDLNNKTSKKLIRNYSYKPSPKFFGEGPIYLGVELEVLAGFEAAKTIHEIASVRSYLKKDSSIAGEGFEIVTHPMSLDSQLDYWEEVLEEVGQELNPDPSCGMHVHLSRQPLTQLQIGKVLVFLNNPENELWIDLLAGRPANYYCQKAEKRIEDALNPRSRYEALNLMNDKTIEFRLFASSNKLEEICSRIEFCHAVIGYCKDCDLESLDWDCFVEWLYISSPENKYHYLKDWVETTPEPEVKA